MTTLMQLMGAEVAAKAGPMAASKIFARCCEAGFRMGVQRTMEKMEHTQAYSTPQFEMQVLAEAGLEDTRHPIQQALIRHQNPNAPEISKARPNWRIVAEERGADCERFKKKILDLEEELRVTDKLLKARQEVLDAIPECPEHGKCIPYAMTWIKRMKRKNR